jgi:hypothetical protein
MHAHEVGELKMVIADQLWPHYRIVDCFKLDLLFKKYVWVFSISRPTVLYCVSPEQHPDRTSAVIAKRGHNKRLSERFVMSATGEEFLTG